MELADVNRHICKTNVTDADVLEQAVNDLKLSVAADAFGETALCDRFYLEALRRFVRYDRYSRAGVEHKAKRLGFTIHPQFYDRTIADKLKRDARAVLAACHIETSGLAEEA